jgi:acyl carrier protein
VAAVVRDTICEVLGVEPGALRDETDLEAEYGIDSLELMAVGTRLEQVLGVRIDAGELARARTVGQAVALLGGRVATA